MESVRIYMSETEAADWICEVGRRMYQREYVASNDGNISVCIGDNEVLCTPTGVSKGYMTTDMLVVIDHSGNVLRGQLKPSSEMKMHLKVYEKNPKALAVVHAHPIHATAFALAGEPLDRALLPEAVVMLGCVPVAPYATPGTEGVPESIAPYCAGGHSVLLANHGALTWGKDILEAYYRMETLEHSAAITMKAIHEIGRYRLLTESQVDELMLLREKMGIQGGGRPKCV